jgi:3-deoxy-D-manno-octulosonic-acid transferase
MIYNLILLVALPFLLPAFLIASAFNPRFRNGLGERLGAWGDTGAIDFSGRPPFSATIWIHAASVGEIQAAWPLVEALVKRHPSTGLILTTLTATGHSLLRERSAGLKGHTGPAQVRLFPVDFPGLGGRLLRKVQPDLILVVETEIWPNFLAAARRRGIPLAVVNGRISPRSFAKYRWIRWVLRPALESVNRFLMQTADDAARIECLGAPPYRVSVAGNLKFERRPEPLPETDRKKLIESWGWGSFDPVWVAGSTHPGEEETLLRLFMKLKADYPTFRLILAPRHLDRIPEVRSLLAGSGLKIRQASESPLSGNKGTIPSTGSTADAVLVDTMGQLNLLYGLADMVFVGGTFVPVGGHNLAEPALQGVPVLYGPHLQQVRAMADLLTESGGGYPSENAAELERRLRSFLDDPESRRRAGARAREAVGRSRGALDVTLESLSTLLDRRPPGSRIVTDRRPEMQRWVEDRLWHGRGPWATDLVRPFLNSVAVLYGNLVSVRNRSYRIGLLRSRRLSRPVFSVGNMTVGGTGKTPVVVAMCRILTERGLRPVVLSRGYGGRYRAPLLEVSDGSRIKWPADVVGDEPVLMARRLPGVPVVVGPDRYTAGKGAILAYQPDVLVLDDGFQHVRLCRDLDLLLIDSADPFGNGKVLPAGPLREPVHGLRRADAVMLTRMESSAAAAGLISFLGRSYPDLPVLFSRHRMTGCVRLADPSGAETPVSDFSGRRVFVAAGIARPESFVRSLEREAVEVVGVAVYPDHFSFRATDIEQIGKEADRLGAQAVLTTEKDWVRLASLTAGLKNWWAVRMELSPDDPEAFGRLILEKMRA